MFLKCHYSTGGTEQVEGKQCFEQLAHSHGIKIKAYRADNGIMAKREYLIQAELNEQKISLAGINPHNQNGIVECNICTVCGQARSMLCHAIERWLAAVTIDLWPFALKMAVDLYNATPGPSGLSPEEIFSRQKSQSDSLVDFHTFGCPVFILDPTLQQGHKIPKWQLRARQAVYLGYSPRHAQTVPIVLNLHTGLCSPQYHVVFNNNFTTTQAVQQNEMPSNWEQFKEHRLNCFEGKPDTDNIPTLSPEWKEDPPQDVPAPTKTTPTSPSDATVPAMSEGAHSTSEGDSNSLVCPSTPTADIRGEVSLPVTPRVSHRTVRTHDSSPTASTPTPPPGCGTRSIPTIPDFEPGYR